MSGRYLFVFVTATLMAVSSAAFGQFTTNDNDPRQMALDVYSGISRGVPAETTALRLRRIVELFRYRCTRVTDFQIFAQRPNITDIKVKCSGDPLYGVTVASNGFVSVYGGNGILSPLDRRDALIYTFSADGDVEDTSGFDAERIREETTSRYMLGGEYDYIYLSILLLMIVAIVIVMGVVFLRIFRRRVGRKPRERVKPMQRFKVGFSTKMKDRLIKESEQIAKYVYHHESGIYLAIGKRGKRRIYMSRFWAKMYARYNLNFNEATEQELEAVAHQLADEVEEIAAGEEVRIPDGDDAR